MLSTSKRRAMLGRQSTIQLEQRLAPSASIQLVSTGDAGEPSQSAYGTLPSTLQRRISDDGRYTVFSSWAQNVIADQTGDNRAVFLHDRDTNSTKLISRAFGTVNQTSKGSVDGPTISNDGRFVSFLSDANDLVSGFSFSGVYHKQIYLFDGMTDSMVLVTHVPGNPTQGISSPELDAPVMSADGSTIVFSSNAANLIPGYVPGTSTTPVPKNVYTYDQSTGTIDLISHQTSNPALGCDGYALNPTINNDGSIVTFYSNGTKLVPGFSGAKFNAYVYERNTDSVALLTKSPSVSANVAVGGRVLQTSADGRYVLIYSTATNFMDGFVDGNGTWGDIYRLDRMKGTVLLVSRADGFLNKGGNDYSGGPAFISDDGRHIAFSSEATDLVAGMVDHNGADAADVFYLDTQTNLCQLVSHNGSSLNESGNAGSSIYGLSADGRRIMYISGATDLINGFVDGYIYKAVQPQYRANIWVHDRIAITTQLVNHAASSTLQGSQHNGENPSLSTDGNWVAFQSNSSDLLETDLNSLNDVFSWSGATSQVNLVSQRFGTVSVTPGGSSSEATVSANGRFVVYLSIATNIAPGQVDTNNGNDVFLHDRLFGTTMLVSRAFGTLAHAGNDYCALPKISADGRFVVYSSYATNLVAGFVNSNGPAIPGTGAYTSTDIFLFDQLTGTTQLVSRKAGTNNVGGNLTSAYGTEYTQAIDISGDGQYVVYRSLATDLVTGFVDNNGASNPDVFLFDRTSGTNLLVSHRLNSTVDSGLGDYPFISRDGRFILFISTSTLSADGPGLLYLYDRVTDIHQVVDRSYDFPAVQSKADSYPLRLSSDGRFVLFTSAGTNLINGYSGVGTQLYQFDRVTASVSLISHAHNSPTVGANRGVHLIYSATMSDNGQFVAYGSGADNLVAGFIDNNGNDSSYGIDVYVHDRNIATTALVSRDITSVNSGSNDTSWSAGMSANGRFITLTSEATNLIDGLMPAGTYLIDQYYVFDRMTAQTKLISHSQVGETVTTYANHLPAGISDDGSVILFESGSGELTTSDFNLQFDIFAYVTPPPRVTSVQINDGSPQRSTIRSQTITFDDAVFLESSPLSVVRSPGGEVGGVQWTVSSDLKSVTVTFNGANTQFGSLADGDYSLTLNASKISGVGLLDGNGDGVGGDDYVFTFHRLFGDADGNRTVSAADFNAFRMSYGASNLAFDFNNDGVVTASDFNQFRTRYGVTI